ncbi:jg11355 [Pararge aegeria aegeria]|uniref:Jg11355 protein n=1 Tax=Pararge aegeria aegeria TaxID=348720 RepID=A0A8S4RK12_9NEOP|nr:jg11355 [Pararge aegeria aegeria]
MEINGHQSAASERWGPTEARTAEEAALEARIRSTQALWNEPSSQRKPARALSPPPTSRKMRARRRQPRRPTVPPPPPAYCLEAPTKLFCDPSCKFQFDAPRPQLTEYQKAMGRLSASVQAVMRANACRCPPYRGTNVSRYAPTGQRHLRYPDRRYGIWWPRENLSPRLENRFNITHIQNITTNSQKGEKVTPNIKAEIRKQEPDITSCDEKQTNEPEVQSEVPPENPPQQKDKVVLDNQLPSTSAAAMEGARKKRLYSTVLSMTPPPTLNLNTVGCLRLSQKLAPGLIKLNPKLVLRSKSRPNVDNKFEELEKEALEQYKASDESIDTKFRALEEEAADQYSTSNSNTSCSSANSGERKNTKCATNNETKAKTQPSKFHKDKSVESVVIYSQNLNDSSVKENTNSVTNLKNFHTPPRGEKKEQTRRSIKYMRSSKTGSLRPASDTDYEARESKTKGFHKGAMRWTLHVMPPKKRHLTSCASDFSSDDELEEASVSIRDAGPCIKNRATGKVKMSAHGGGDLHPIMRKT